MRDIIAHHISYMIAACRQSAGSRSSASTRDHHRSKGALIHA
jgi:hypothetical protein